MERLCRSLLKMCMLSAVLSSCSTEASFLSQFSSYKGKLSEIRVPFETAELGSTENIDCYGSILVTHDYQQGFHYGAFNAETGKFARRFGKIGQAENEILVGTWGKLWKDSYYVFNPNSKKIYKYSNLLSGTLGVESVSYDLESDARQYTAFTNISPVSDGLFLAQGIYHDNYHYVLFDRNSVVKDSLRVIGDESGLAGSASNKMLTNQGPLIRCADRDIFVSATYNSSDIDFIEVKDSKMKMLKSYSNDDLILNPTRYDNQTVSAPTSETITGFLDLAGTDRYVFALYSDRLRKENRYPYWGRDVLVFDWTGKKLLRLVLGEETCKIAASGDRLYALQLEDDEYTIKCYRIDF